MCLAVLWEALKSNIPSTDKYDLARSFDEVLGLNLDKKAEAKEIPENIRELMKKREELRAVKKFQEADEIRKQIAGAGFEVNDSSL
jgi:cysteinyl-tRNA synthetase